MEHQRVEGERVADVVHRVAVGTEGENYPTEPDSVQTCIRVRHEAMEKQIF